MSLFPQFLFLSAHVFVSLPVLFWLLNEQRTSWSHWSYQILTIYWKIRNIKDEPWWSYINLLNGKPRSGVLLPWQSRSYCYHVSEHILQPQTFGRFFFAHYYRILCQILYTSCLFVNIWWHLMTAVPDQVQLTHGRYPNAWALSQ